MNKRVFLTFALLLMLLFVLNAEASAETYADCSNCHTSTQFTVQPLPRANECYTCHGVADHAYWFDLEGNKYYSQYVLGRGYFKNSNSYTAAPAEIHQIHAGSNNWANTTGCTQCHQVTACDSCHNNVGHNQHSLTGVPSVPKYTPPSFPQANGSTLANKSMSCALSECHQTMPGVVKTKADGSPLCSNCHAEGGHNHAIGASGYDADPQASCKDCHATNADKTTADLIAIHQQAATAGKIPNFDCNTCHNSTFIGTVIGDGTLDMQRNGQPIYCVNCHDGTKAHGVNHKPDHLSTGDEVVSCNGCHNGTISKGTFNAPNGTAIDVTNGAVHNNCDKCHASSNTAVQDFINSSKGQVNSVYLCSTCHGSITPSHNKLHVVNDYLAAGDSTGCQACHSKDITVTHEGAAAKCDACHGANPAYPETKNVILANLSNIPSRPGFTCESCHPSIAGGGHQHPVTSYETNAKVDCATCHATDEVAKTTELAKLHADQGIGCAGCHNSTYEGGTNPIIVKNGVMNIPTCSTCHTGVAPYAPKPTAQHEGTISSHGSASGYGTYNDTASQGADCTNCHGQQGTMQVHSALSCNTCHTNTVQAVKDAVYNNLSTVTTKPGYTCAECHNSLTTNRNHAPEHQATNDIESESVTCTKCHSFNLPVMQAAGVTGAHGSCNTCHSSTVQTVKDLVYNGMGKPNTTPYTCNNCHSVLPVKHNKLHTAKAYVNSGDGSQCAGCHNSLDVTAIHANVTGQSSNCDKCHATTVSADVYQVISSNLSTVANRPGFTCESCHPSIAGGGHQHPVTSYASTPAVTCSQCHATDSATQSTELSKLHADKGIGCSACHNSTYEGGTNPIIIKNGVMNVPTCGTCHTGVAPFAPKAETTYPEHNNLSTANHSAATTYGTYSLAGNVSCSGCHPDKNIRPVHQNTTCDKCHTSTVSAVQSVITGNWSRTATKVPYSCADCHNAVTNSTTTQHKPVHAVTSYTSTTGDTENCSSTTCHGGTNVVQDHVNVKTYSTGTTMTCDTCHASTNSTVSTLIVQQSRNATPTYSCNNCHTLHGDPNILHNTTFVLNPTMDCVKCHSNRIDTEHTGRKSPTTGQLMTCDTCHRSTNGLVRGAIDSNNTKCTACHTTMHSNVQSVHVANYFPDETVNCAGCHTATNAEFTNTSNKALHAIPGTTSKATGGTYVSPWTKTSTMDCRKCHNATNGTYYGRLLVKPYTTSTNTNSGDLCFICHDYQTYQPNGSKTSASYSNFKTSSMNLHTIGDHSTGCQGCHSTKPHGQTTREHFIVLKGEANAATTKATMTRFTHATSYYSKSNCSAGCGSGDHP